MAAEESIQLMGRLKACEDRLASLLRWPEVAEAIWDAESEEAAVRILMVSPFEFSEDQASFAINMPARKTTREARRDLEEEVESLQDKLGPENKGD